MKTSTRYYLMDSLNTRSIVDGRAGLIVDNETLADAPGETREQRSDRLAAQEDRWAALNAKDYETRRQQDESRREFVARRLRGD